MSLPYRPVNDSVLIEPEVPKTYAEQTGTPLVLPDVYKWGPTDPPCWGVVRAKGSRCVLADIQVGHRVLYGKFGWAKLPLSDGHYYAVVRECDILAVDEGATSCASSLLT